MRAVISGTCDAAKNLRTLLSRAGIVACESGLGLVAIDIQEDTVGDIIIVDGIDSELERRIVKHICEFAPGVYLKRQGGVRAAHRLAIIVPTAQFEAVEKGCLRGLVSFANMDRKWFKLW
jgi:hypothetical protein